MTSSTKSPDMVMPSGLPKAVAFFWEHAGWSCAENESPAAGRLSSALMLATAAEKANENGVRYSWETEAAPDRSGISHDSPLWNCVAYLNGAVIGSLCNIDLGEDANPWSTDVVGGGFNYARVVEAEIALEHFANEIP